MQQGRQVLSRLAQQSRVRTFHEIESPPQADPRYNCHDAWRPAHECAGARGNHWGTSQGLPDHHRQPAHLLDLRLHIWAMVLHGLLKGRGGATPPGFTVLRLLAIVIFVAACKVEDGGTPHVELDSWRPDAGAMVKMDVVDQPLGEISRAYSFGAGYLVLDYSLGRVVVYDSAGAVRRQVGRVGSGPGEFRMLLDGSGAADASKFAVLDPQNLSISVAKLEADTVAVSRFVTRPSMGTLHYLEGDTLLAYTPFGSVISPDTVFFVYREDGELVAAFGRWTKWSDGISPGISQLLTDASSGQLVAAEAFGHRIAWYAYGEDSPVWESVTSEGPTIAAKMDSAVRRGVSPSKTLTVGVMNAGLWLIGRDSALVRQDSVVTAGRRISRYVLVTRAGRRTSEFGDIRITDVVGGEAVVADQDDEGVLSLGRMPIQKILQRLSPRP